MRFLYCSDIHITSKIWKGVPQITGDALQACREINAKCKEHGEHNLVLGGDTFDATRITAYELFCYKELISGLNVWFIDGTHDPAVNGHTVSSVIGSMVNSSNERHYGDLKGHADLEDNTVYGINYKLTRPQFLEELAKVPETTRILILHNSFKHLLGHEGAWVVQKEDIPTHIKLVLAGDVHTTDTTIYNDSVIVSTGSAYPRNSDQTKHPNKVAIIDSVTASVVEWHNITVRNYFVVDCEQSVEEQFSMSAIMPALQLPTVALCYYSNTSAIPQCREYAVRHNVIPIFVHKKEVPTEIGSDAGISEENELNHDDIRSAAASFFDDQPTAEFALQLYASSDPKTDISEWLTQNDIKQNILKG